MRESMKLSPQHSVLIPFVKLARACVLCVSNERIQMGGEKEIIQYSQGRPPDSVCPVGENHRTGVNPVGKKNSYIKKIVTIVGARPQFIKAAAVSSVLKMTPGLKEVLVHTGQHYDVEMSDVFFGDLDIPEPDHHLGIGSAIHGAQTGRMLEAIEGVLLSEKPDLVMVYGDTNSTLSGALAAVKLHIPVAHVEAGLRSFNRQMPEEINRVLTDHAADFLFAPTTVAAANLEREGISPVKIYLVGDVMYDAALHFGSKAEAKSSILEDLGLTPKEYVLATVHRAENTDDPVRLRVIFECLRMATAELPVVVPLHPRTREALKREDLLEKLSKYLRLVDPVGYLDMIMLEKNSALIATDSGGVQKEAFFYNVPCVTLREETEWIELVDLGWNFIALPATDPSEVMAVISSALGKVGKNGNPYGDGQSARKVVAVLSEWLGRMDRQ